MNDSTSAAVPDALPALPTAVLGARFSEAVRWAAMLHADDVRKGTRIAYVSHLLGVASLVLEDGGSEEEAIAAMLHDAIEDRGTPEAEIRARFGQPIADIVVACSEPPGLTRGAATWRERKTAYLAYLEGSVSESALRVTAADKLHNARSILSDLRDHGPAMWDKFNAPAADQRWYYTELARLLAAKHDGPTVRELQRVVADLVSEIDRTPPRS
ncbi:MAG: HD domain-containing protein [Actinobacteria bacterium]|nr:HD domain-containing protein [Actinomycetota bacterium]